MRSPHCSLSSPPPYSSSSTFSTFFSDLKRKTSNWRLSEQASQRRLTFYRRTYRETLRKILDAVVLSSSDQQLITSFAILISVQHFVGCSISAYHYDIVCNLILMSLVTHLASLVVIKRYFSNKLLGPIRVILIFIVFSLAGVMFAERDNSRFPTGVPNAKNSNTTTAPPLLAAAACFTSENITIMDQYGMVMKASEAPGRVTGLGEYVVLFVITLLGLMVAITQSMVTSSSSSSRITARKWIFVFRLALLFGAWAIATLAYIKFTNLQKWLAQSPWPQDDGEGKWDFGQTMPCILLLLTPLSFLEACAEACAGK